MCLLTKQLRREHMYTYRMHAWRILDNKSINQRWNPPTRDGRDYVMKMGFRTVMWSGKISAE